MAPELTLAVTLVEQHHGEVTALLERGLVAVFANEYDKSEFMAVVNRYPRLSATRDNGHVLVTVVG